MLQDDDATDLPIRPLNVGSGACARTLAVRVREGDGPALVWMGGFRSDMRATKALALDRWAKESGRALIRFDYSGHGASEGRFEEGTISTWLADAEAVLDRFAGKRPLIVGSSMGGWIACLTARNRVGTGHLAPSGLVLIAPALDFTEALMWRSFTPEIRAQLEHDGVWYRTTPYAEAPDPIRMTLIEDGRRHLLLEAPFETGCPVHILQGMRDPDVPHAHALRTLDVLPQAGTLLTLIPDGDHRLSRPQDLQLLLDVVRTIA